MKSIDVTLPDGSIKNLPEGTTSAEVARSISPRLEKDAVAAVYNEKIVDLHLPLKENGQIKILTKRDPEALEVLRHSTAHLLANAVQELYKGVQVTIGPVTEDGFYYDFSKKDGFVPEDLPKIEKKMKEIAKRAHDITRKEWSKEQAINIFKKMGEEYKVEIIESIDEDVLSTYEQGDWIDLCRGPHVPNTAKLGKFKLLSIAGAYWRGDENKEMLQRIYGTAFFNQKDLDEHLHNLEEAKKRDHRKLGPEMGLFNFLPIAPAMPFYLPKGTTLYENLIGFMRKQMKERGYQEVICPQLMSTKLWKTSGHLDHFSDNMFFTREEEDGSALALKPMNCPGHVSLYASTKHSYRELPIRLAEFSRLHRDERGGATHGIFRVRSFSQDDAHIFCTKDQLREEAKKVIEHTLQIYEMFDFTDVEIKLATRDPENFMGELPNWERATKELEESLKEAGKPFTIAEGEAAFYGPKIEFHIRDSLKRSWQCGTVQVDFNLPERFDIGYVDTNGDNQRPVMIHRAILGSLERFLGILIEHYAGHLPLWLAPVQAILINVTDDQKAYAESVRDTLADAGMRVELDDRNEKLGYRIREAQLKRIPLMLILGQKEVDGKSISVRRSNGETVNDLSTDKFFELIGHELKPGGKSH